MSAAAAVLPLRPGDRYAWMAAVLDGLTELLEYGAIQRGDPPQMVVDYNDNNHRYKIDGQHVPSVTGVLNDTEVKEALNWWAFRIGMAAVVDLLQQDKVSFAQLMAWRWKPIVKPAEHDGEPEIGRYGKKEKLKSHLEWYAQRARLDPMTVRNQKGTVGTSIHVAAEQLQITGVIPAIEDFPADDRGYVQALARYWVSQDLEIEAQEVIVASKRFQYAGRFDKIVRTPSGQRRMRDYKTAGGVYSSNDKQLALYDLAYLEMGGVPLDGHDIVHLQHDGNFEVIPCTIDHGDALIALLKRLGDRDLGARLKTLGREL